VHSAVNAAAPAAATACPARRKQVTNVVFQFLPAGQSETVAGMGLGIISAPRAVPKVMTDVSSFHIIDRVVSHKCRE